MPKRRPVVVMHGVEQAHLVVRRAIDGERIRIVTAVQDDADDHIQFIVAALLLGKSHWIVVRISVRDPSRGALFRQPLIEVIGGNLILDEGLRTGASLRGGT